MVETPCLAAFVTWSGLWWTFLTSAIQNDNVPNEINESSYRLGRSSVVISQTTSVATWSATLRRRQGSGRRRNLLTVILSKSTSTAEMKHPVPNKKHAVLPANAKNTGVGRLKSAWNKCVADIVDNFRRAQQFYVQTSKEDLILAKTWFVGHLTSSRHGVMPSSCMKWHF